MKRGVWGLSFFIPSNCKLVPVNRPVIVSCYKPASLCTITILRKLIIILKKSSNLTNTLKFNEYLKF